MGGSRVRAQAAKDRDGAGRNRAAGRRGSGRSGERATGTCGSRDAANHALAVDAARACGAFVVPTETVVYRMLGNSRAPGFKALLPLFK